MTPVLRLFRFETAIAEEFAQTQKVMARLLRPASVAGDAEFDWRSIQVEPVLCAAGTAELKQIGPVKGEKTRYDFLQASCAADDRKASPEENTPSGNP